MPTRERLASGISPLFIRLALALTFIWAGLGKLFEDMEVKGQTAAMLANMGLSLPRAAKPEPAKPPAPVPSPAANPAPAPVPTPTPPPPNPAPAPKEPAPAPGPATPPPAQPQPQPAPQTPPPAPTPAPPAPPAPQPTTPPATPPQPQPAPTPKDPGTPPPTPPPANPETPKRPAAFAPPLGAFESQPASASSEATADQFPDPIKVRRVYGLALLLKTAAFPAPDEKGQAVPAYWPRDLAQGTWPVNLAWSVAITELAGGTLLLIGMLTRLAALALGGTMIGAVWLTQIGPAVQSGKTVLGFLPDRSAFDIQAWQTPLWQVALLAMALSVVFSGAGALSIDRSLFGPGRSMDE
ncbi:MAG: DoxX family protein [Phycisphaerae bacterium]|nr:DoxX family protein [Phycisphaerae bacterium]